MVRDQRNILYYGASHTTFDHDTLVKCAYNSRSENFELRYLIHDDVRNIDRVDWKRKVDYSDATYATWKAAVACRRVANGAARNSSETQVKKTRWLNSPSTGDHVFTNKQCMMYYANARSLRNKTIALEMLLSHANYDVGPRPTVNCWNIFIRQWFVSQMLSRLRRHVWSVSLW